MLNKYFYEVLKIRLENILRPLSLNYKARILYGSCPSTDIINTVYLPVISEIVPNKTATKAELLLFYKHMTAHEGAHIRYTSISAWQKATKNGLVFQHLTNIIEDGRVEALISEQLPGVERWIRFGNNYIYNHRPIKAYGEGVQAFLVGLATYSVCQKIPSLEPDIVAVIKKAAPYVDIGKAASSTEKVFPQVEAILALPEVRKLLPEPTPLSCLPDTGTENPEEKSSDKARERAKKAEIIILQRKKEESAEESTSENNAGEPEEMPENSSKNTFEENSDNSNIGQETTDNSSKEKINNDEESFFNEKLVEEDLSELISEADKEIVSLSKEVEELEEADKEIDLAEGLDSCTNFTLHSPTVCHHEKYQSILEENKLFIKKLIEEIKHTLETKKSYDLRSQTRGRLDTTSLWKLKTADTAVFSKKVLPGDTPELAVYILVDCSYSMTQSVNKKKSRMDIAKDAACIISETCRELKITHAITGFCADPVRRRPPNSTVMHYPAVEWGSNNSQNIASLEEYFCNKDGYSIRVATKELLTRPEPRKILFILSDGTPTAYTSKAAALEDTKTAALEAKKQGVKVISLFFGDEENEEDFLYMYENPVFVRNVEILPRTLGTIFKKIYLQN